MRLPVWFAERLEPASPDEELRVSTLELFFDLVFVFTIIQLTGLLTSGFDEDSFVGEGALRALLVFGVLWWMYSGYAWLTNTVPPVRTARRILILLGMAGFLIVALALPRAFADGAPAFALGYLIVVLAHGALYLQATARFIRVLPWNLAASALLLCTALVEPGSARYALWALAVVVVWVSPYFIKQEGFPLNAVHIVERHGLLVIVVLGESILAIGLGAQNVPLGPATGAAAVLGLSVAACLWWVYFAGDDKAAEETLIRAETVRRTRLILGGYFYAHIPLLLGVVAMAAGIKKAIGHPADPLKLGPAVALSAGVALFLLGNLLFRRVLGLPGAPMRLAAAVLVLAAIPIGRWSALAQLAVLAVVLIAALALERPRAAEPGPARPSPAEPRSAEA